MQDWLGNGASRVEKSCEIPFVLSGSPLPCPGSNQTAARPVTNGHHGPLRLPRPAITAGNRKPGPASAPPRKTGHKTSPGHLSSTALNSGITSTAALGIEQLGLNQFTRKYIYHLLARITAYTETHSGRPDLFDKYVDRTPKNACDIEHIWPDAFDRFKDIFETRQEFDSWRNDVAALLLLPADVNRSLQGKPYEEKVPHYAKQNLYAASLAGITYKHQPQFTKCAKEKALPFQPYATFTPTQQLERSQLVLALVNRVWSPDRLDHYRL